MAKFERLYSEEHRDKRDRDRFQVEFNKAERIRFMKSQMFIEQAKDATAIKQLALLGGTALSNPEAFSQLLKDTLLRNERNNKRHGISVQVELERRFPKLSGALGGNLTL